MSPVTSVINHHAQSILEESFDHIGDGFREILQNMDRINSQGEISVKDTLALQQSTFHYSMYQEVVTKIASKSANAINEVLKAQ